MIDVATLAVWGLASHRLFVFYMNDHPALVRVKRLLATRVHEKLGYCELCLSVWVPAAVLALWFVPYVGWIVVSVLALSEAAVLLDDGIKALNRVGMPPYVVMNGQPSEVPPSEASV